MKTKNTKFILKIIMIILMFAAMIVWTLHLSKWFKNVEAMENMLNWTDSIDAIYYINLDSREDRKEQFLHEMYRMNVPDEKIIRISATYKPGQGDWGCSLSHIDTLQKMIKANHKNCIVFEDDFEFTAENIEQLKNAFQSIKDQKIDYDVIMLSGNEIDVRPCEYKDVKRVFSAQTTSGYMVSSNFAPTLLKNYQEGAKLIEESYKNGKGDAIQGPYCIDQYWKKLQPISNWYIFYPKLGKQYSSVSDIQGGYVNMDV